MSKSNKIIPLVFMSVLVGIFAHAYMQDSDFDGVPNDEDEFPNNMNEWNDNDKDGIGAKSTSTAIVGQYNAIK